MSKLLFSQTDLIANYMRIIKGDSCYFNYTDSLYHNSNGRNTLRLNFSNAGSVEIEKGIKKLGRLFGETKK